MENNMLSLRHINSSSVQILSTNPRVIKGLIMKTEKLPTTAISTF